MATKFAAFNEVESVSCGTAHAYYPVSNLLEYPTYKEFRATGNSAIVDVDLGTARPVDTLFLCGNNSTGELPLTNLTLKANVSNSGWDAPAFEVSYETDSSAQENCLVHLEFALQTFRYWRLEISNPADTYTGFSNLYLGGHAQTPIDLGFSFSRATLTDTAKGRYGQRFTDVINSVKVMSCSMSTMTLTEKDEIEAIFNYCDIDKPLWVYVDTSQDETEAGIFYVVKPPVFETVAYQLYNTSFELEEVV